MKVNSWFQIDPNILVFEILNDNLFFGSGLLFIELEQLMFNKKISITYCFAVSIKKMIYSGVTYADFLSSGNSFCKINTNSSGHGSNCLRKIIRVNWIFWESILVGYLNDLLFCDIFWEGMEPFFNYSL